MMGSKVILMLVLGILEFIVKQFKPTEVEKERQFYAEKISSIVNHINSGNMGFVLLPSSKNVNWGSSVEFGDRMEPARDSNDKRNTNESKVSSR